MEPEVIFLIVGVGVLLLGVLLALGSTFPDRDNRGIDTTALPTWKSIIKPIVDLFIKIFNKIGDGRTWRTVMRWTGILLMLAGVLIIAAAGISLANGDGDGGDDPAKTPTPTTTETSTEGPTDAPS